MGQVGYRLFRFAIRDSIGIYKNVCKKQLFELSETSGVEEWSYAENIQKKAPLYETETDSVYTLDELYRLLYETLNKLPENYRTVFMKSFFEGKTHAEIAEEMNLSVKSINRYKQKTMELLRNELKDYLPLFLLFLSPEQL